MVQEVLSIENVIKDTFLLFKNSFKRLILSLIIFIIPFVVIIALMIPSFASYADSFDNFDSFWDIPSSFWSSMGAIFIYFLIALPIFLLYTYRSIYNKEVGIDESSSLLFKRGLRKIFPFWGLSFLVGLIGLACLVPFGISFIFDIIPLSVVFGIAGYIGAIIIMIALSCCSIIQLVEDRNVIESIKGSWELTKNRRARIFIIYIVLSVVFSILMYIVMFIIMGLSSVILYLGGADLMSSLDSFVGSIAYSIFMMLISILTYPLYFSFYMSIFINLKRDKGKLFATNIVDDFMKEDKEEGVDDNWQ